MGKELSFGVGLKVKRTSVLMPAKIRACVRQFAKLHDTDMAVITQAAITQMSMDWPGEDEIMYEKDAMLVTQVSLSDTGTRLLEMWSEKTGLSKSKLVVYALQKAIYEPQQAKPEGGEEEKSEEGDE